MIPGEHTEISDSQQLVNAPVVSVLMLAYNHEPWIAEAIESVLAQDCGFDYEIIIGEDGSSDRTREIALGYQQLHPHRIRVVYPPRNGGAHANHRRLSALARGEFVAYCEGDDYWCRVDKLSAQVALLRNDAGAAMVHTDWVRAKQDNEGWQVLWRRPMHRRMPLRRLQGDLFRIFYLPKILRTCTVMQRRTALQDFYDSSLANGTYRFVDTVMSAYMTSRWRVAYWPQVAAVYRESPGSALRSGRKSFLQFLRSALQFDTEARQFFKGRHDYPASYRWECALGLLLQALRIGEFTTAMDALRDLRANHGPGGFLRAGAEALRVRWPMWRARRTRPERPQHA